MSEDTVVETETGTDTTAATQDTTLTKDEVMSVDRWRETLPEDIRTNKIIEETKDLTSIAKRLIDANAFISKSVRLPDDGDTSGMDELYVKLGRPENADGYKLETPEDLKEYQKDGMLDSFKEISLKVGNNPSQAKQLMEWYNDQVRGQIAETKQNAANAMGELKKEWGTAFDERVKIAEEVLNQYGNDVSEAAIKDNAGLIQLVYKMGKNLVEGTTEGRATSSHIRSPKEAQAEIDKLNRDPNFTKAYYNKKDPTHNAAVEQMRELMVEAHPEPEAVVY